LRQITCEQHRMCIMRAKCTETKFNLKKSYDTIFFAVEVKQFTSGNAKNDGKMTNHKDEFKLNFVNEKSISLFWIKLK
jgi:hypothetical protein